MAKNAGRLAGLAALAGAAYMMSKGKDKEAGTTDSNPTRAARPNSTETREEDNKTAAAYPSGIMGGATQKDKVETAPVVKRSVKPEELPRAETPKMVSEPSDKSVKLAPENRDLEATMTRGQRTPAAPVSTVSSSEEGMKNYVPRRKPPVSTVSSSEEGMRNYKPRRPVPPIRPTGMKKGGMTASKRADGIASKGKTKCKMY